MAESQATPHKQKGPKDANGKKDVHSTDASVQSGWASELDGRILLSNLAIDDYLDQLVPCSTSYESANLTVDENAFSEYEPGDGLEVQCTPHVRNGLANIVADFDDDVRLSFWDSHNGDFRFPLSPFASNHANSSPDISVSFPGAPEDVTAKTSRWEVISMCIEAKDTEKGDPFPLHKSGASNMKTIIQLARNARTLMLVHGFLYSIVLGIYGDIVRIARFDRTVCIVSRPFNLRQNLRLLQRFFWHYTHPMVGSPVVGCDPTIRPLTTHENTWLLRHLSRARVKRTDMDIFMTRRVEVHDDQDGTVIPYFVYQVVDVNPRLMSRSTMVWRAIKDTSSEDKRARNAVKSCIVKDSWRQLVRRPEAAFYRRIASTISDEDRWGLPKMLAGGDIGQMEFRAWELCSPNAVEFADERNLRLPAADRVMPASASSASTGPPAATGAGPSNSSTTSSSAEAPSPVASTYCYPSSCPLPWPQHQTVTWSINMTSEYAHRERSHMRFVIEDVGRPLTEFRDTRELVTAMRDALKGHELAYKKAGILHRDISLGNVLIVDEPTPEGPVGFLHDFDYSSMTDVAPGHEPAPSSSSASSNFVKPELKERTGTRYFMACEIMRTGQAGVTVVHRVHHDLESFYWVILWVVLRHTQHNLGQAMSEQIFEYGDLKAAIKKKTAWLRGGFWDEDDDLIVEDNAPLTELMRDFKTMVTNMCVSRYQKNLLTHEAVIRLFDDALAKPGWPAGDRVKCTLLDPRSKQEDADGLYKAPEIRRMTVSDCSVLQKRSGTIAGLDVPQSIPEEGTGAEARPSTVPEKRPSSKRLKSDSQAAAMGSPPSPHSLLQGMPPVEPAAGRGSKGLQKKGPSRRS